MIKNLRLMNEEIKTVIMCILWIVFVLYIFEHSD